MVTPLFKDDEALLALAARILAREGVDGALTVERFKAGSLPVYAVGQTHVLKLFPAEEASHANIEARTMQALQGRLPMPTPRLLGAGVIDAPAADGAAAATPGRLVPPVPLVPPVHYVLMSRLHGEPMVRAWPGLGDAQRDALADMLGASAAALHAIDAGPLADFEPRWDAFAGAQRSSATARQRKRGLSEFWCEQVDAFLDCWMPAPVPRNALLHTELMREHLLVEVDSSKSARLSGVFDFEPAMVGPPEYDFASIGIFCACGDARFLTRTLRAYGYARADLDSALQCRFMAYALLHRYSNLDWYLERLPAGDADTLEKLAARWWPLQPAA